MSDPAIDAIDAEMLADAELAKNDNVTKSLAAAIGEWAKLDAEKTALDAKVKEIVASMNEMKMKQFPDLLAAFGSLSFTDEATGLVLGLETLVTGGLSKTDVQKRDAQLAYIVANGGAPLVRTAIEVVFDRGDAEKAQKFIADVKALGVDPNVTESIHAGSLAAWGRDKLEAGAEIDFEKAGLYVVKIAEPKVVKTRVSRARARK